VRVEVLYVADCPSHPVAVKLVKSILLAEGLDSIVHEVLVLDERMAQELRFSGSPTIRINGRDVVTEPGEQETFSLTCRWYAGPHAASLPPHELVRRAIMEADR
jgi:hypothetical protein